MQDITNHLTNGFIVSKEETISHILAINAPTRIEVLIRQFAKIVANESKARQKHGRPINSKDKNPREKKRANNQVDIIKE